MKKTIIVIIVIASMACAVTPTSHLIDNAALVGEYKMRIGESELIENGFRPYSDSILLTFIDSADDEIIATLEILRYWRTEDYDLDILCENIHLIFKSKLSASDNRKIVAAVAKGIHPEPFDILLYEDQPIEFVTGKYLHLELTPDYINEDWISSGEHTVFNEDLYNFQMVDFNLRIFSPLDIYVVAEVDWDSVNKDLGKRRSEDIIEFIPNDETYKTCFVGTGLLDRRNW